MASVQVPVVFLIYISHVRALNHSKQLQKCQHLVHKVAQCSVLSRARKHGYNFFCFILN